MKLPTPKFYRHFLDGLPLYLVRHYWWAYLWSGGVWLFDHQPIINAILFGQYRKLMRSTMARMQDAQGQRTLQLTCVYGELTPKLIEAVSPEPLYITDIATVQLELARAKAPTPNTLLAARMNAEQLAYKDDSFSTVVVFFLLHEVPEEARERILSECMRVIPAGGTLLITEYAPLPTRHAIYRFAPSRWLITTLEPFLDGFWRNDIPSLLDEYGKAHAKRATAVSDKKLFSGFYRVSEFKVEALVEQPANQRTEQRAIQRVGQLADA